MDSPFIIKLALTISTVKNVNVTVHTNWIKIILRCVSKCYLDSLYLSHINLLSDSGLDSIFLSENLDVPVCKSCRESGNIFFITDNWKELNQEFENIGDFLTDNNYFFCSCYEIISIIYWLSSKLSDHQCPLETDVDSN